MRQRAAVLLRDLSGLPDLTHHRHHDRVCGREAGAGEGSPAAAGPVHLQRLRLCGAPKAVQVMVNGGERTNGDEVAQCEPADGDEHADRDDGVCSGDRGHDSTHT